MTRPVGCIDTAESVCIWLTLGLSLSHLLVYWSGFQPTLNYLMTHCTVPGLQRHCSILTVFYLQIQGASWGCVLSPFWDDSWEQSPFFLSFLFLFSFPHSTWEGICVDSWKGCISLLDLWCGCSKPGLSWMTRRPGRPLLLQFGCYGWVLSSHPWGKER